MFKPFVILGCMGANNADFNGLNFMYSGAGGDHVVTAHHSEHGQIGHLIWRRGTGEIVDLLTEPEHERKGVATGMWEHAKTVAANSDGKILRPQHSAVQTPKGKRWAKKVGK